jgi:hypothetical protein
MKRISFIVMCMTAALFFSTSAFCRVPSKAEHAKPVAQPKSAAVLLSGKVLETMDAGGYTYAKIDAGGKQLWLAMPTTKLKVGEDATFYPGQEMRDFKSAALKRTFDSIIFTNGLFVLPGTEEYRAKNKAKPVNVKVEKAKGSEARTVAQVYTDKKSLAGKKVSVRGKVVKISMGIMGKNWVHIQDGTGSPEKGTNDLVVTTLDESANVGDVVTATGTVTADRDFGYGYRYDVIMEQASIKK